MHCWNVWKAPFSIALKCGGPISLKRSQIPTTVSVLVNVLYSH